MAEVVRGPVIDILARTVPELSTTSDMPTVDTQVVEGPPLSASSDETPDAPTPLKTDKGEASTTADPEKTEAQPKDETDKGDGKKKETLKERMGELTAARREAEQRAEFAEAARVAKEAEADALQKQVKELVERVDKAIPKIDEDPRPQRAAFDDPNKYDDALMGWSQRQGEKLGRQRASEEFRVKSEAEQRKATEDAQTAENQRISKVYAERVDRIKETEPDYEALVTSPDLPISQVVGAFIMTNEDGPKVALHLAKNIAEAKRISELPPMVQLYEVGKIGAALNAPPKTTTAPNPIDPIKAGNAAASKKSPNEESMQEYAARRQSELAAERASQAPPKRA